MSDFFYDPMSEEEALKERFSLLPDGTYRATIILAEGKISNSGNPMGVFTLRVWDADDKPKEIIDYIPSIRTMAWKMRHLCAACNLMKEYESNAFRPELTEGKNVSVIIKTAIGKEIPFDKLNGKPSGTKYPNKNIIEDYEIEFRKY